VVQLPAVAPESPHQSSTPRTSVKAPRAAPRLRVPEIAAAPSRPPGPKRLNERQAPHVRAVPANADRSLKPNEPSIKKKIGAPGPLTHSAGTHAKELLPAPEPSRSPENELRIVKSKVRRISEREPEPERTGSRRSAPDGFESRLARVPTTPALQMPSPSFDPKETERPRAEAEPISGTSVRPARRPHDDEQATAIVKIGSIEVQVTPPPVPTPPVNPRNRSERPAARSLSRGFTSSFGLRQG